MGTCLFFPTLFYTISIVLCNLFMNIHKAKEKCLQTRLELYHISSKTESVEPPAFVNVIC